MSRVKVRQIRGLPDALPDGERLLWQGAPAWRVLCVRAFHVRKVAAYFGLLIGWRVVTGLADDAGLHAVVAGCASLLLLAAGAIAMLSLLAWLAAHTTVYSITSRRVVLRCGIALSMDLNIPFSSVRTAGLNLNNDGTGDIALTLPKGNRIAYLTLWPHARPWHFGAPQPMLRCVPDAARVADLLARSLAVETGGQSHPIVMVQPEGVAQPAPPRARAAA